MSFLDSIASMIMKQMGLPENTTLESLMAQAQSNPQMQAQIKL